MRYFYEKNESEEPVHGVIYQCNHPLYNRCTLYLEGDLGLAVIQQRFSPDLKYFFWGNIDRCLIDDIYNQPDFSKFFAENAKTCKDGLYPTVKLRKLMWALRMKPLKREFWED